MKALLLAGGRGTRMRPLTHTSNKHAIPIANKPLILYPFEMIVEAGIKDIAIIVNETREEIENIIGDGSKWKVKVSYIFQDKAQGLAHALSLAEDFMGKSKFVMVLGDNILEEGITKYVVNFKKSKVNGHILGVKVPISEHKRFGVATTNNKLEVLAYIEKPGIVDKSRLYKPKSSYAVPGFYFLDHNVFKCFKGKDKIRLSARGELEIPHAYNWIIKHGYKVTLDIVNGWYKDPGSHEDTLITNQIILETITKEENNGKVSRKSKLSGKISIGKGTKIKNSVLRGPLSIGENCLIENSFIGPFTSIYHNSTIINCEIENSIILGEVNLYDISKRLDSCIIGWNAEVTESNALPKAVSLFIGDRSIVRL
jgi:glucose-1-phosphate thymidylyltransferase